MKITYKYLLYLFILVMAVFFVKFYKSANKEVYKVKGPKNSIKIIKNEDNYTVSCDHKRNFIIKSNSEYEVIYKDFSNENYDYMEEYEFDFHISKYDKKVGVLNLILRFTEDGGLIYYTKSQLIKKDENPDVDFFVVMKSARKSDLTYTYIDEKNDVEKEKILFENINESSINCENNNFLKCGSNEMFFSDIYSFKNLGQKVFKNISNGETYVKMNYVNGKIYLKFDLSYVDTYKTFFQGYLAENNFINFEEKKNLEMISIMSFGKKYFIMEDGVYWQNFKSYEPFEENSYFRCPSAILMKKCLLLRKYKFFKSFATSIAYSYLSEYNDLGYIPNKSKSKWLFDEYNIDKNFYDTRWNTDTFDSLINFYEVYDDYKIKNVLENYYNFFVLYFDKNSFSLTDKNFFISDYMDFSGNNISTHCSLNHYLAEMNSLLNYYRVFDDKKAYNLAIKILNSIDNTSENWIKENGDLYYSVNSEGYYEGDDYVFVTYNDLSDTVRILDNLDIEIPEGINKIYTSKKKFLIKNKELNKKNKAL